ncbi:MAG: SWIB/MDM2 domain-containing protein [Chromatiaceae bacterium]|jgi:chromatin remodeling complex protein RSC6
MATTKTPVGKRKPAAKKAATTKAAKTEAKRTPNAGFMKPMTPSDTLAAVVGAEPLPRPEVTKRIWEYIKQHALQDANDKRMINADERLSAIFGKAQVSMFEMTKIISQHLK